MTQPISPEDALKACHQCGTSVYGRCRLPGTDCSGFIPRTEPPVAMDEVMAVLEKLEWALRGADLSPFEQQAVDEAAALLTRIKA